MERARRGWKRLVMACAVPTLLACGSSPVAPEVDELGRLDTEVLDVNDPIPLEGTDHGGEGPPLREPEWEDRY